MRWLDNLLGIGTQVWLGVLGLTGGGGAPG